MLLVKSCYGIAKNEHPAAENRSKEKSKAEYTQKEHSQNRDCKILLLHHINQLSIYR